MNPHVADQVEKITERQKMKPRIKNDNEANALFEQNKLVLDLEARPGVHFITTLNKGFIPGFQRLLESIQENSGLEHWDMSVIALDEVVRGVKVEGKIAAVFDTQTEVERLKLKTSGPRFAPNFNKLCVWSIDSKDVYIFIDSDTVVTGDLNELRQWKPNITAVRNFALNEKTKRDELSYHNGSLPIFNTGVFCFQPDKALHEDLVKFIRRGYRGGVHLGDQEILNDYFAQTPEQVNYAGYEYNYRGHLTKQFLHPRSPTGGNPYTIDPKIVHFIHATKPWMEGEPKPEQELMFKLWKKEITTEQFLEQDRKARKVPRAAKTN